MLFRGIASILGPPLGGLVYESSDKGKFRNVIKVSSLLSVTLNFAYYLFRYNKLPHFRL